MFFFRLNFSGFFKSGKLKTAIGLFVSGVFAFSSAAYALSMGGSPLGGPGPAIVGGGGNLTTFSGNLGALNNAQWNAMMNPGKGTAKPVADFGNCNALILRCASPKCPGGGCSDMNIARTIVRGCVQSNQSCAQYGDDLVEYISAQLVANATNRAQEAEAQAQAQAAAVNAMSQNDASAQQLSAMQQQMQQMQQQMVQQQQASQQQIEQALAERNAAQAQAQVQAQVQQPAPVSTTPSVASASAAIDSAIAQGVSADVIARNQATGRIMEQLENVTAAMANVKKAMQDAFDYAGCDSRGENCTGPRRVAVFKQRASAFFDPFETVQDEVYDALIQAQALGVDISDIYMMLSSSCNVWGQYLCEQGQVLRFHSSYDNCDEASLSAQFGRPVRCPPSREMASKIVPMASGGCQLLRTLASGETVFQSWLDVPTGDQDRVVAVACASDALDTSKFFQNRRKKIDDIGIDDLALILSQDAIVLAGSGPNDLSRVCQATSERLTEILMSNRYSDFGGQNEALNPKTSVVVGTDAYERDAQSGILTPAAMQVRTNAAIESLNKATNVEFKSGYSGATVPSLATPTISAPNVPRNEARLLPPEEMTTRTNAALDQAFDQAKEERSNW